MCGDVAGSLAMTDGGKVPSEWLFVGGGPVSGRYPQSDASQFLPHRERRSRSAAAGPAWIGFGVGVCGPGPGWPAGTDSRGRVGLSAIPASNQWRMGLVESGDHG